MKDVELNELAHQLLEIKAELKRLEALEKELIEKIQNVMVERGTEILRGDNWIAKWTNVLRETSDSKRFKADHSDLYSKYAKKSGYTRFTIR